MNQKIIKEGVVTSSSKKLKGGFNLNQFVLKFLEWIGFAATVDCCTYYPTYPILQVANINDPTEEEMANVPPLSFFRCVDETTNSVYIYMRNFAGVNPGYILITNN